ncbi:hypothetical protein SAMN05444274_106213 [Mariniphaga anaerophila]|uniref:Sporulation related domain-containing protein n=1 Tax=Mariniphaga anaerophila TaxID=1484053 RepID=A0A1M5CPT2_9BACT|nr:hypothetical protein [Mariniphaga anaerophila]SHF56721.1 hypothetical protein SAMN05444274_106213 [Mariniphaga anaerophila]
MKLGKYIQHLLLENETVIVPGFGAFISEYKPARIDKKSGEMTPPSKAIYFDSKIKNNDGLLADEIAADEQISESEALQKIGEELEEIYYHLDKGDKVTIENTGTIFYNENREIQFTSSEKENLLLDAFGLDVTSTKEEPEEVDEEVSAPVITAENDEEAEPDENPMAAFRQAEPQPEEPTQKKKRGWLWFLLILIPVAAAGFFILKKERQEPPKLVEIIVESPAQQEEPPVLATDSVATPAIDSVKTEPGTMDSLNFVKIDSSKFYLVGGSFVEAKNAEEYFQHMKAKGFEPFFLGKRGNFFLVGLETYNNETEAYGAQYNFLDKHPGSGVWVLAP